MAKQRIVAIVGATAVGKSALALELAKRTEAEIVNADALQVYRGLDIGTAKPSLEERRRVPHHLIDILDPRESFSAGEFARRAHQAIRTIGERGRLPLVVGGSGLYLRALTSGLAEIPPIPASVREQLQSELRERGLSELRRELQRVDPELERRLAAGDTQRVLRGLEIWRATSRSQSSWLRAHTTAISPLYVDWIGLTLKRAILYDRIESRVHAMLERGWVAEIERLRAAGVPREAPAFQAIGYRQLTNYLSGESTLEQAIAETVTATRRYAKRQHTWFKREPEVRWIEAADLAGELPGVVRRFLFD